MAFLLTFYSPFKLNISNLGFCEENAGLHCRNIADGRLLFNPDWIYKEIGVDGCQQYGMVVATFHSARGWQNVMRMHGG